ILLQGCSSNPGGPGGSHPPDMGRVPDVDMGGGSPGAPDLGGPPPPPAPGIEQSGGTPSALAIVDHTAYLTVGPRLTIWDVTTPSAPTLRGQTEPLDGILNSVAVAGGIAYVGEPRSGVDSQLRVIDVADGTHPSIVATIALGSAQEAVLPRGPMV